MDKKIVANEELLSQMRGVTSPATLCDASGNPVAVVVPANFYKDLLRTWTDTHFRPEMAEAAWQDYLAHGGRSTADVLDMLKKIDEVVGHPS